MLAGNCKANLKASASYKRHLETWLESKRVLEGVGEEGDGLGQSFKKLWCFYSAYRDHRNITKKAFTNNGAI